MNEMTNYILLNSKKKNYLIMRKMFWAIFMISFNFFLALTQYTCTSDLACVDCQFYLITTGFGLFGYYYCGQCSINYSVNQVSGVC